MTRVAIWDGDSMVVTLIAYPRRTYIAFPIEVLIFDQEGSVIASISLSRDPHLVLGDQMEYFATEIKKTVSEISHYMGTSPL